jgi:hypothetical protein
MAFASDAQRKRFFANLSMNERGVTMPNPMPPSFGWNEKPTRGDVITDRIYAHEERIYGSGVGPEFAAEQRLGREAFIQGDKQLSVEDKAKLLSYSGKFYK